MRRLGISACSVLCVCFGSLSALENEMDYPQSSIAEKACQQLQTLSPGEMDQDWQLNAFFGHIKIIGSKDSPRYPRLLETMKEVGLSEEGFELSPAVVGATLHQSLWSRVPSWAGKNTKIKQGIAGCAIAHYNLIKDTKEKYDRAVQNYARLKSQIPSCSDLELEAAQNLIDKYSSVLVMEDNTGFGLLKNGVPTLEGMGIKFRETLAQLPDDWDMLYLMSLHGEWNLPKGQTVSGSPLLLKAAYGLCNKCFAVRASIYDKLLKQYESFIYPESQFLSPNTALIPADHLVASLHERVNAYITKLPFAYRFASSSMVGGIDMEKWNVQFWPR